MKSSTFKRLTALMISVMLVFSMCITGISASAAETTKTIYFAVSANWEEANARFVAYCWADGVEGTFTSMTEVEDGIYSAEIADNNTSVIFVRMNPETTENNWENKWNQTADLSIPADKNCFSINEGEWDGANGTWSEYVPVVTTEPTETTVPVTTEPIETTEPATTTPVETGRTLYFTPSSSWSESDPRFVMYMWGDGVEGTFTSMTIATEGVYSAKLADGCTSVIFVRMDPEATENNWDNKWNQTADLLVPEFNNYFTLNQGEWDNANGTWSMYVEPTEPVTTEPATTEPVETTVPETTEPATTEPVETTVPETTEPVTTEPVETTTPETTAPETTAPVETTVPTTTVDTSEFTYNVLEDGTAEITGYTGNNSTVVVPSTIDGYNVTRISRVLSSYYKEDCTALIISEGVTTIGSNAMYGWYYLEEVQLPESLEVIKTDAFRDCPNLTTVKFPANLQVIGDGAFSHCYALKDVTITGGKLTLVDDFAFHRCDSLESVTLKGDNAKIGQYAFKNCGSLNSLTIDGIKTIDMDAFCGCNLEDVVLPEGLESLTYSSFALNSNLKSVYVPKSVTKMDSSSFYSSAENFTMYGYSGSYAETFVKNNPRLGITFVVLDPISIVGDINLELTNSNGIYSGTTILNAGTYNFKVDVIGTEFGCGSTFNNGMKNVLYCSDWKKSTTFNAVGGEYTFSFNCKTNKLTVTYKKINADSVKITGDIDLELIKSATNPKLFSATVELEANTYLFKINADGKEYGCGSTFTNSIYKALYSSDWKKATTFITDGGKFTFTFDMNTNKLTVVRYTENSTIKTVTVSGDRYGEAFEFTLNQSESNENIFTATTVLKVGYYNYKVVVDGVEYGCGGSFDNQYKAEYRAEWTKSTEFYSSYEREYTFTFNTNTNKLTVMPVK